MNEVLDNIGYDIEALARDAYAKVIRLINDGKDPKTAIKEALKEFQGETMAAMTGALNQILASSISIKRTNYADTSTKLSSYLHERAKDVATLANMAVRESIKTGASIDKISKLLYEGYDFKDDPMKVKKGLPKYILNPTMELSQQSVDKLKTPALKAAYRSVLMATNERARDEALRVALFERNRYYANRIAQTELARVANATTAMEYMADDSLEVVRYIMSGTHPKFDQCDYWANANLYGLGKGLYPKAKAPLTPLHPHCRCRCLAVFSKSAKGAKYDKKAEREYIDGLSDHEKRLLFGSDRIAKKYEAGTSTFTDVYDAGRAGYKTEFVGKYENATAKVGYNVGMDKTFEASGDYIAKYTITDKRIAAKELSEYQNHIDEILEKTANKYEAGILVNGSWKSDYFTQKDKQKVSVPIQYEKMLENGVMIHNHIHGTSFSDKDIALLIIEKMRGVVIASNYYHYKFELDSGIDFKALQNNIKEAEKIKKEVVESMIEKYGISQKQLEFDDLHLLWSIVADTTKGVSYGRYR